MGTATGFCILGRALAVVGLRGDIKRGIICSKKGGVKAICTYILGREGWRGSEQREHTPAVCLVSIKKRGSIALSIFEIMQLCSDLP